MASSPAHATHPYGAQQQAAHSSGKVPARLAWRLGWRLLRGRDARQWTSLILVIAGVAAAVLSVLCATSAFRIVGSRSDRVAARSFLFAENASSADAWVDVHRMPYGNRMVLRVDIALSSHPPQLAPGLTRWPRPGEEFVSPSYRATAAKDHSLATYAPGKIMGVIGNAGLVSPDELVVYRGTDRAQLPRNDDGVVSRHGEPSADLDLDSSQMSNAQVSDLIVAVLVCLGLPIIAFLIVAARLSAGARSRRLATLYFLGMPKRGIQAIQAVELLVFSLAGAGLALVCYPFIDGLFAGSNIVGVKWFPSDTRLNLTTDSLVVGTVLVLAMLALRRVNRESDLTSARIRRSDGPRVNSKLRLLPLAIGAIALAIQVASGLRRSIDETGFAHLDLIMTASILITGGGLLLAVGPLISTAGNVIHRHGRSLGARLGGARAVFDPAGSARLAAGLAILVFAVGVTIGQTRDARAASTPTATTVDIAVGASDLSSPANAAALLSSRSAAGIAQVYSVATSASDVSITADVASCDQIRRFVYFSTPGSNNFSSGCKAHTAYWVPGVDVRARSLKGLPLSSGETALFSTNQLSASVATDLGDAQVLLTVPAESAITSALISSSQPFVNGQTSDIGGGQLVLRTATKNLASELATIYTIEPYSQPLVSGEDPDNRQNISMINGYIHLGLLGGALMALFALITALADRATERRRADHELLAAGVPQSLVRLAHRWEVSITMIISLGVASVAGIMGGLSWQLDGGLIKSVDWSSTITLLVSAAVIGTTATIAASLAAPKQLDISILRGE